MGRLLAALAIATVTALACGSGFAAEIRAPPVRYDLQVLPNGLKVYSVVDTSRPEVAVQVWYDVGSKDDPPGRAGFAHLFEHLMFKGSPGLPPEYMDQFTESVGGSSNASTTDDYTAYEDLVPGAELERALWAEAVRMNALAVTPKDFAAERAVVEQEVREVFADDPYGRLFMQDIAQASFVSPAFRQSPAGSIHDLEAATLADVAAFKALYYRPDNAALIVVGDFDPAQLRAWVAKYFGVLRAPPLPPPRIRDAEPPRHAARRVEIGARAAPAPAVVLSYSGPTAASPDAAAVRLLDQILTGGDSGRGTASLVQQRRIASEVFSEADLRQQTGLIYFGAIMAPGHGVREGEAALRRELAWLQHHRVSPGELATAKAQILAATLAKRETVDGLAGEIGEAVLVGGDAAQINTSLAALETATPADVQRVARAYCIDRRRVTIRYGAGGPAHSRRDPPPTQGAPAPHAPHLRGAAPAGPPVVVPPPPPQAIQADAPKLTLPAPTARVLPNGLRVVVAPSGTLPLATAVLTIAGGSTLDPPGRAGLTDLVASLALRGAGGRSADGLAHALAGLGLKLSTDVERDSTRLELTGLSQSLPLGLALLADVARRPSYLAAELRQALRDRTTDQTDPSADAMVDAALQALVFGRAPSGTGAKAAHAGPPSRAELVAQHDRLWRPDHATLVVAGAVSPQATLALAQAAFGDWRNPAGAPPQRPPARDPLKTRVIAVDLPGAELAEVAVAARATAPSEAARAALEVANTALGDGASSRLSREIRIKRGLSYDVSSELDLGHGAGMFSVRTETRNAAAPEVAQLIVQQLRRLGAQELAPAELAARKATLLGDYARRTETTADLAEFLAQEAAPGGRLDTLAAYPARIQAVSAADVRAAAATLADPAGLDVLIIGDTRRFGGELQARFPGAKILGDRGVERAGKGAPG